MKLPLRTLLFAAMFTALTAVGAFIKIPVPPYPVPLTLQTAFVYLCGLLLPPAGAFFAQLTYVLLGLLGIPVFTGGGGIGYVLHPTFGYLLGFLAAAPAVSLLSRSTLYRGCRLPFALGGLAVVLLMQLAGVGYMALISSAYSAQPLPLSRAVYLVYIFLPLDLFKFALAALLGAQLRRRAPSLFVL